MRKIIITILAILLMSIPAFAETYLLVDNSTKAIISMSPEDDAQIEAGQEKVVIKDKFFEIKLDSQLQDYFYINEKFVKDYEKISKRESDKIESKKKSIEIEVIKKRALKDAYEKLKAENYNFKEVKDSDYE